MSEENVEIVREAIDAFNRRDFDAFVARVRPDIEWDDAQGFPGSSRALSRAGGDAKSWEAWLEVWESFQLEVEEITERERGPSPRRGLGTERGRDGGVETGARTWYVLWVEDGEVARRKLSWARDEALDAAGLREWHEPVRAPLRPADQGPRVIPRRPRTSRTYLS